MLHCFFVRVIVDDSLRISRIVHTELIVAAIGGKGVLLVSCIYDSHLQ